MTDRTEEFILVRRVREAIRGVGEQVQETTATEYRQIFERMAGSGTLPEHASSRSDYYRRRAALVYFTAVQARGVMRVRDKAAYGSTAWQAAVNELTRIDKVLGRYPPDPDRQHAENGGHCITWRDVAVCRQGEPCKRRSKRIGIGALLRREGWRDKLFEHIDPRYKDALAVAILTGARPCEIERGITIRRHQAGLEITIGGAKVGRDRGQPVRTLLVSSDCAAISHLEAMLDGDNCKVSTNAKRFSDAVAQASERAWPRMRLRVTPYTLRHAVASSLKAAHVDPVGIAEALGHRATRSAQVYGQSCHGQRSLVSIVGVCASAPVRNTRRSPAMFRMALPVEATPRIG